MTKRNLTILGITSLLLLLGLAIWLVTEEAPPLKEGPKDTAVAVDAPTPQPGPRARPAIKATPVTDGGTEAEDSKAKVEVVLQKGWGHGDDQLGHRIPDEGAPEGPMAFVVDDLGRIYVLDQVNQRVQVYENGKRVASIGLPADTYQDLELSANGDVVVMDRLNQRSVSLYSPDGKEIAQIPLEGENLPEGGGTTGLFSREDGLWVEVEHQQQVRIADAEGNVDSQRPTLPGRFSADGRFLLMAAKSAINRAIIYTLPVDQPQSQPNLLAEVQFPMAIMQIAALQSDAGGRILLVAQLMRQGASPPFGAGDLGEQLVVLDAAGREFLRLDLPIRIGPEEQFRPYRVGADGALYQMFCGPDGVTMRRFSF